MWVNICLIGILMRIIKSYVSLFWLFGKFKSFYTVAKKQNLKIETEDNVCCLLQNKDDLPTIKNGSLEKK